MGRLFARPPDEFQTTRFVRLDRGRIAYRMKAFRSRCLLSAFVFLASLISLRCEAQDWVHTGTNLGNERYSPGCGGLQAGGQRSRRRRPLKAIFDSTFTTI